MAETPCLAHSPRGRHEEELGGASFGLAVELESERHFVPDLRENPLDREENSEGIRVPAVLV